MSGSKPARNAADEGPELSVVVPLFNEEENLPELHRRLRAVLEEKALNCELVYVNDGSRDRTADMLEAIHVDDPRAVVVHLSRNFGHQAAVCAGIDRARGRAVVVMDGDLQDPPEVIPDFVQLWRQGNDVVYAVRRHRKENFLKRFAYGSFYRLMNAISDLEIPLDSGDFGLMDRRVVDALKSLPEQKRFVRGLRTFVGFRQVGLAYERAARSSGTPKYTFRALVGLAIDGLVSFSSYPLHVVTHVGLLCAGLAFVLFIWVLIDALYRHTAPQGWASTVVVVLFMGSVQLISLGIMGEYIRLIFLESKGRPTYIVAERRRSLGRTEESLSPGSDGVDSASPSSLAQEVTE
jgi:polyisoprenyl-phosphate glycosyltransferase